MLALLPPEEMAAITPDLDFVMLKKGQLLGSIDQPLEYVYFITAGLGSVVLTTPEGRRAEAGIFGFEGHVPAPAITGTSLSLHDVTIQIAGSAYRISYADFRRGMETLELFPKLMMRASEAFAVQLAYTAVSNAVHDISVRLARWLLMCHDRVPANEISLTHDALSLMLGVRRPSVTTSLHVLEGHGLIRSERGLITIRHRADLEDYARDAYGKPEEEYRKLMADLPGDLEV
nr:Crp/Fnr family transcriptional regulator [Ciceribacter sp. L1K23]